METAYYKIGIPHPNAYIICAKCKDRAKITNWEPAKGLDPLLCEFVCCQCGTKWYKRVPPEEREDCIK